MMDLAFNVDLDVFRPTFNGDAYTDSPAAGLLRAECLMLARKIDARADAADHVVIAARLASHCQGPWPSARLLCLQLAEPHSSDVDELFRRADYYADFLINGVRPHQDANR